ncbi:MAG TPA: hypothetical protein PL143_00085 [Rhodocyclaceae bacterium]|nr:hypothetical protein [Rhodocyclaceae bacterium]
MALRLQVSVAPALPRLAWCATVRANDDTVAVTRGAGVECGPQFAVEGAWDGRFEAGAFPAARHFFGSGVRVDGNVVHCAASSGLVDRIVYARATGEVRCSNSLPVLLAATGCRLDPGHDYTPECHALMAGRRRYRRAIHAVSLDGRESPQFGQVFGENLRIDGDTVEHSDRDHAPKRLSGYADYVHALDELVAGLVDNLGDPARTSRCHLFATVSSGYDSTAVASLVKAHGVRTCFTTVAAGEEALENGAAVASALGLETIALDRLQADHDYELAMLAATLDGREAIFQSLLRHVGRLDGTAAVFTGYHGDKVWDRATSGRHLSPDILRGDTSGLNLTEARLWSGFINVALPFAFANQIADIVAISNGGEMAPWRLQTGYDRPIPRRIAETAGVPRELFGQAKRVVMDYAALPRNPALREELFGYLEDRFGHGWLSRTADAATRTLDFHLRSLPLGRRRGLSAASTNRLLWPAEKQLANRIHVWAVNVLAERFARIFRG